MEIAISAENLHKRYGDVVAVEEVSFQVEAGEIFGMVGPNGAGKTTTIECLEGLRTPDRGEIRVLGLDPARDGFALRKRMGVQLQEAALPPRLKVWEACDLFAAFYPRQTSWEILLERMGLADKRNAPIGKLSGGQKQRLFIVLALLSDPEVVFLDELTSGLDPQARRAMWDQVRAIREEGKTVFLTTHFMDEAEQLCDRVAILDHGQIIACDTPENLVRSLGEETRLIFSVDGDFDPGVLAGLPGVRTVERSGERIVLRGTGDRLVSSVVLALEDHGYPLRDLRTETPNLEDVFLELTGRAMRD
ncbi:MAG: ABC transporter ATP-binding protein [Caldilineae bacterium]|nr:MAG: ABC transporter ATP-binding protein [Caldilineae bacterium]